jgi:hypothetical protein
MTGIQPFQAETTRHFYQKKLIKMMSADDAVTNGSTNGDNAQTKKVDEESTALKNGEFSADDEVRQIKCENSPFQMTPCF